MEKQTTDYKKTMRTEKQQGVLRNILVYFLLLLWAVIVLFPFYWMLLTSVKSYGSYNAEHIPSFFTLHPTLQNYQDAFTAVPLGRYLANTLFFTIIDVYKRQVETVHSPSQAGHLLHIDDDRLQLPLPRKKSGSSCSLKLSVQA